MRTAIVVLALGGLFWAGCGGGGSASSASLSSLTCSTGTLVPAFDPNTLAYTVGPGICDGSVRLTPTAEDAGAAIAVDGAATASGTPSAPVSLPIGATSVSVVATAPDGVTQKTYTVLFTRGGPGAQEAYVKASRSDSLDYFGSSVAISGDTLVVGAEYEDSNATGVGGDAADNTASDSGAAYVFVRNGATWSPQAYLKASNTEADDGFGVSVAISNDTIVVGASSEDSSATGVNGAEGDNGAANSGAAYVFVRSGNTWNQQAYLKASNPDTSDEFGTSVAIAADTIVVGALFENGGATGVNGDDTDNSKINSGAAYVFVREGTTWSQQAYLKASNTDASDSFGVSVAISGDTIVVGANGEDSAASGVDGNGSDNSKNSSGAAYVFLRNGTSWTPQAYLKASNPDGVDVFGRYVGVSGETIAVGAPGEDSSATGIGGNEADNGAADGGAAYVFVRNGATWNQQAYIKASNAEAFDWFGLSIFIAGDTFLVGAPHENSSATGLGGDETDNTAVDSGAVYVFMRSGVTWSQQAYVKASNTEANDEFGLHTALAGDTVVASARQEDSRATGVNGDQTDNSEVDSGAAYVIR